MSICVQASSGRRDIKPSLVCPTCRTVVTLSVRGVAALMDNTYAEGGTGSSQGAGPVPCDLCEETDRGHAHLTCSACKSCFCGRCRKVHDKLCKTGQVTEIKVDDDDNDNSDKEKMRSMERNMMTMQNQIDLLCRNVANLEVKCQNDNKIIKSLQEEVSSLKDKNAIICQDNQHLKNDLANLQKDNCDMKQKYDQLENELNDKIDRMNSEFDDKIDNINKEIDNKIDEINNEINENEINVISTKVDVITGNLDKLEKSLSFVQTEQVNTNKDLKKEINDVKSKTGQVKADFDRFKTAQEKRINDSRIMFDVVDVNCKQNLKNGDKVIPKNPAIFSNEGNGYDKKTGIFTAPISGLYSFTASFTVNLDDLKTECSLRIEVDGSGKGGVRSQGNGHSTTHAAIHVKAGQKVYLGLSGRRCTND